MSGQDTKTDAMTEIRDYEANCNGTDQVHAHWLRRFRFTDGVKFVADKAGAYWLIDAIASHQNAKTRKVCQGFQVWELSKSKKGDGYVLLCHDGDQGDGKKIAARQCISFSDFPLPAGEKITLFLENDVLMLAAER